MRPLVTDRVAWSVGRSVCRSVALVSPAKTAEPIEMPFGLWARIGLRNHVLDGSPEVLRVVAMATFFCFLYMGCKLAPLGEYDWIVRVRRLWCGLMSNYFDYLFIKSPFTRYNLLSNWLLNRFDNRLYRVYKHSTVWQPVWQPAVSCVQPVVKPVVQPV